MIRRLQYLCCCITCFALCELEALSLHFSSHFFLFENADFRSYDRRSFEANRAYSQSNTDDQTRLAYSDVRLRYEEEYQSSKFYLDAFRSAHWGTDNYQGRDEGKNSLYFSRLYFVYSPKPLFAFTFGRYKYAIGDALKDYFFSDTIDGFQLDYKAFPFLSMSFMTDLLSNSVQHKGRGIYGVIDKDEEQIEDFQGDTISWRHGINWNWHLKGEGPAPADKLGLRTFLYHLRYGASTQGGSDLAENGFNRRNKPDNDYLSMGGARLYGSFSEEQDQLSFDLSYAYSRGRDLQFAGERIYDGYGFASHLYHRKAFAKQSKNIFSLSAAYFHKDFAGMKAASMGGMLLWAYKGYYAAPYAYHYHFRDYAKDADSPQYIDRTNSKIFARIENTLVLEGFTSRISCLGLWESLSREYMGTEIELEFRYQVENIRFRNINALFIPTDYYSKRAALNPFLPQGKNTFYGIAFRVEYVLDLGYLYSQKHLPPPSKSRKGRLKQRESQDRTRELFDLEKDELD